MLNTKISYGQLALLISIFILGGCVVLLFSNNTSQVNSFSTMQIVAFVLSVLVSGASIVLAIVAISFGRESVQTVIDRSDESIRLQNEVFIRTTDTMQKIASSTGITEKRLEDMIAGRAGDISEAVASDTNIQGLDVKQLEETLSSAIIKSMETENRRPAFGEISRSRSNNTFEKRRSQRVQARDIYKHFKSSVQEYISNMDGVKKIQSGDGHGSIGEIYKFEGKTIGMAFIAPLPVSTPFGFDEISMSAGARQIRNKEIDISILIFFEQDRNIDKHLSKANEIKGLYQDSINKRIRLLKIKYVDFHQDIIKLNAIIRDPIDSA